MAVRYHTETGGWRTATDAILMTCSSLLLCIASGHPWNYSPLLLYIPCISVFVEYKLSARSAYPKPSSEEFNTYYLYVAEEIPENPESAGLGGGGAGLARFRFATALQCVLLDVHGRLRHFNIDEGLSLFGVICKALLRKTHGKI